MDYSSLRTFATTVRTRLLTIVDQQITAVLAPDSWARRESPASVTALEQAISRASLNEVVETTAYTWFNRFCALRYFDVQGWNHPQIITPDGSDLQPAVLALVKQDIFPDSLSDDQKEYCNDVLSGRITVANRDQAVYRILFIDACHMQYRTLPFLFEALSDYMELLLPNDLLTSQSVLADIRAALTVELCESVEVLGWLYQYYIAERKDNVMASKQAYATADIPAVTQLFTPNWIVRYLVENSLGRLWIRSHPQSTLHTKMKYYVADDPNTPQATTITVKSPEEIRLIDPACGSGHMLVYAFDLLVYIYEEQGYARRDIPRLILTHNLYGIDLCPRATQLAALALVIKARIIDPSFFRLNRTVAPQITLIRNITIPTTTIQQWGTLAGLAKSDMAQLHSLAEAFTQASTLGSLITSALPASAVAALRTHTPHDACTTLLDTLEALSQRYHVVVANPPYMGNKWLNKELKEFIGKHFADYKSDLFSAFIVRSMDFVHANGYLGFMTPFVWMFISSYEELRHFIINQTTLTSLVQLEYSGFDGATVPICTFTLQKAVQPGYKGGYIRLSDFRGAENQAPRTLQAIADPACGWFFRASAADFAAIPGSPIAYWVSERMRDVFSTYPTLSQSVIGREGLTTGNNDLFLRFWYEVNTSKIAWSLLTNQSTNQFASKWFPYLKGGSFRRWSGNLEYVVNWENDGDDQKKNIDIKTGRVRSHNYNGDFAFQSGFTWSGISSSKFSARYVPKGYMFDAKSPMGFPQSTVALQHYVLLLNSIVAQSILLLLAPTLDFKIGQILNIPTTHPNITTNFTTLIALARADWDAYETSWDFSTLPLLRDDVAAPTLAERYQRLQVHWQAQVAQMHALEVENNRIFIDAYGLADELSPDVPLREITLTCNPVYRYGDKPADELAALQRADTVRELLSYAIGCMVGRYSLDKPGLILANAGDGLAEYVAAVGMPLDQVQFAPDDDGIIPITAEEWFSDDIVQRTRAFLAATCGNNTVAENQHFIEQSLGKSLRAYFTSEFYKHHLQSYKKRPIYWLFKSPKGTFACLMAMHRYRPDTLSIMLNRYLRQAISIVEREKQLCEQRLTDPLTTTKERNEYTKQLSMRTAQISELREYERTMLALASQQIAIDLDDGVKVNYLRFGNVLERIQGIDDGNN